MKITNPLFLLLLATLAFSSCSTVTYMSATWSNPEFEEQKFNNILVLAITDKLAARKSVELEIVKRLTSKGIKSTPGLNVFRSGFLESNPDETDIQLKLADHGIDALITIAVLDIQEEQRYVPGSTTYQPRMNYNAWYNYAYQTYDRIDNPGYYTNSTEIFLESNFYDVASSDLIWTGQSHTADPNSLVDFSQSYAESLVKSMYKDKILTK